MRRLLVACFIDEQSMMGRRCIDQWGCCAGAPAKQEWACSRKGLAHERSAAATSAGIAPERASEAKPSRGIRGRASGSRHRQHRGTGRTDSVLEPLPAPLDEAEAA